LKFSEIVNEAARILRDSGRVSYRALKREFDLDDEELEDLKEELIEARRVAFDENGRILVWAENRETPQESVSAPAEAAPFESPPLPSSKEGERRQLTVMFCDLVGSTELSETLDPEDLLEILAAYQKAAGGVVERYEGHVAQYLGDGLMVYFGWPVAHEEDASRAVRASLEIVKIIKDVESPTTLRVRIGIATGPVVVGATGEGDASIPKAAVGETPNVAARLQKLAGPGEIVISPTTHRLTGNVFEYDDLGLQTLKGIAEPLRAWRIVGESVTDDRFGGKIESARTPLVGRDTELTLLLERWDRAKDGEGQVVLFSGEPGIGKSRITQALREELSREPHTRLRYQCSAYYSNTAFYPICNQLEHAAGFTRNDTPDSRLDKLEILLARSSEKVEDIAPLFAALLSLPMDRYAPLELNPEQRKRNTIDALAEQVTAFSSDNPVLMIFEDVHWIDPTTLELLNILVDRIQEERVLAVITCRPEFEPPWHKLNHVSIHSLNRLSRRQGAQIVADLMGGTALPNGLVDQIIAKTDGVPLFVEELTKTIIESGIVDRADEFSGAESNLTIPVTLQDSLMARLDRLESGKKVAQVGACIGREFSYELVQAAASIADDELKASLQALVEAELVYQRGALPQVTYTFKHALIQDTAYQSLLKTTRQRVHARIAEVLDLEFHEMVERQPELLALHYTGAGIPDQAITYWQKAGERDLHRSANREAVEHFRKGLALIPDLPDESERIRRELVLQASLGPALIALKGYGAPETAACYDRAQELLDWVGDSAELFRILYGNWVTKLTWAEFATAQELAEQFLSRAIDSGNTGEILTGHRIVGFSRSCRGQFAAARNDFEKLLALYQPKQHSPLAYLYGQDPKAAGASMLGWNLWHLGYPDQAVRVSEAAVAYARDLKHANTRGYAEIFGAARVQLFRRDREGVDLYADSMLGFYEEHQLVFWLGFVKTLQGWSLIEQQQHEEAINVIQEGLRAHEEMGTAMFKPHTFAILAQAYAGCGRIDDSLQLLNDGMSIAERTSESWIRAELHRLKGEMVLRRNSDSYTAEAAESCFEQSIAIARSQGAKSWELRATTSLAQLWEEQGKRAEAYELLFEIYDWFTEGFDSKDLQDAKSLLDELI